MSNGTFLRRLRRDTRGNTLAIMAAAMVPLMGFTGSAIDMARLYVVKTRLQQACDAGVLAGRKAMTDTFAATPLDTAAKNQADAFFANNFPTGWYQTNTVSFTPAKSIDGGSLTANAVRGEARATVPMAVMGFFGSPARELVVTCQARYDLADTDIMFVLDTTGSMSCVPSAAATCGNTPMQAYVRADGTPGFHNPESSGSKMQGLRDSVMLFDETMRASADATTNFRYGFVSYSSSVNVGRIVPSQYLQSTVWTYQSRRLSPDNNGDYNNGGVSTFSKTGTAQTACVAQRLPATGYARTGWTWSDEGYHQARRFYDVTWTAANGGTCSGKQQPLRAMWRYEAISVDVSGYVNSLTSGNPVTVPGRLDGLISRWRGCIEEVNTSAATSFNVNDLPNDLDPDFKPSAADNKWRPMWPEATWMRGTADGYNDQRDGDVNENASTTQLNSDPEDFSFRAGMGLDLGGFAACGKEALPLRKMTRQEVSNYVNHVDFKPFGGTYHDVGMIWGARMLSPDGVFSADTAAWPGRNEPSRSIVFMTDGNMAPDERISGLYGPERLSKRITGGSLSSLAARHNARFRIACDAAKRKGMTVYVVAFGAGVTMSDDLRYCASPGQAFPASDTAALRSAFQTIAQRVAALRITQ